MDIGEEIAQFLKSMETPIENKKTTFTSDSKPRKHNHFPQGKTGYDPKTARLANHDRVRV